MTYGFPCQDISVAGKQRGLSEGSDTRSSLLWEAMRIAKYRKPKYMIAENVKNLLSKKFKDDFNKWLVDLDLMGYNTYYQILNAKDFGLPQNRERVFVVSIRKDIDDGQFNFPNKQSLSIRLKNVLENNVDEKYYLSEKIQQRFKFSEKYHENIIGSTAPDFRTIGQRDIVYKTDGIMGALVATDYKQPKQIMVDNIAVIGKLDIKGHDSVKRVYSSEGLCPTLTTMTGGNRQPKIISNEEKILIKNATTKGYIEAYDGDGIDLNFPDSNTRRGRVQPQRSHTLTTGSNLGVLEGVKIRKLTPLECWRLQGFSDEDFQKVKDIGISDTQLYKQAGNSIAVKVLDCLLNSLLNAKYSVILNIHNDEVI